MNSVTPSARATHVRLYFRLMDVCLLFAGLGLADHLLGKFFDRSILPHGSTAYVVVGVVTVFFNFFMPPFLIVARFMRDEYAELLWTRSIAVLAYIFAMLPLLMMLVVWCINMTKPLGGQVGPATYLFGDISAGKLVITTWMAFLLLWVGIFQFLRWRDSL